MLPASLRHALRSIARHPLHAAGVIGTLTLAFAAATSVLTLVDRVLWRPLPLVGSERVFTLLEADSLGARRLASYPTARDWAAEARMFEGIAHIRGGGGAMTTREGVERVIVALGAPGFGQVLGLRPTLGRLFTPDEERSSGGGVALIAEALWRRAFGSRPDIIGQPITVDDATLTVVGVIPAAQRFPEWAEVYVPLQSRLATTPQLENRFLHVDSRTYGRLAARATPELARTDLARIQRALDERFTDPAGRALDVQLQSLRDETIGEAGGALLALGAAVGFLLLLALANVANLTLLRAAQNAREFAVRTALGATRARIVRHLLVESTATAAVAGALAIGVSVWVLSAIRRLAPAGLPRLQEVGLDARGALLTAALTLVCGLAIGLLVAMRASSAGVAALRDTKGAAGASNTRRALTAVQLAVALVLLVGSALLLRSIDRVLAVDLGYDPQAAVSMDIRPPADRYPDEAAAATLYAQLVDRLTTIPGVTHAAFVNHRPMGPALPTGVSAPGYSPRTTAPTTALYRTASEGYAEAVGLRLVKGRWFTRADIDGKSIGVVISARLAQRIWPDADPIGRSLTVFRSSQARPGHGDPEPSVVIGVIADVRPAGPEEEPSEEVYLPYTRETWDWGTLVVRTTNRSAETLEALQRAVLEVDAQLPANSAAKVFTPMAADVERFVAPRRFTSRLAIGFAAAALLLGALGVYTVSAFGVSQRTREVGVRMALGATPQAVRMLVLRESLVIGALGVVAGVAITFALGRYLQTVLFGVEASDPVSLVGAMAVLLIILIGAAHIPARRAARLDPAVALRSD